MSMKNNLDFYLRKAVPILVFSLSLSCTRSNENQKQTIKSGTVLQSAVKNKQTSKLPKKFIKFCKPLKNKKQMICDIAPLLLASNHVNTSCRGVVSDITIQYDQDDSDDSDEQTADDGTDDDSDPVDEASSESDGGDDDDTGSEGGDEGDDGSDDGSNAAASAAAVDSAKNNMIQGFASIPGCSDTPGIGTICRVQAPSLPLQCFAPILQVIPCITGALW